MLDVFILRRQSLRQQVEYLGIRQGKQHFERSLLGRLRVVESLLHIAHQQHVEFAHTASTAPFELGAMFR